MRNLAYIFAKSTNPAGGTGSRVFNKGTKTERTETGKTAKPLVGTKTIGDCTGKECCSVDKTFPISLWMGDDEVSVDFTGNIILKAKLFEKEA